MQQLNVNFFQQWRFPLKVNSFNYLKIFYLFRRGHIPYKVKDISRATEAGPLWLLQNVECKGIVICSSDVDGHDFPKFGLNHFWSVNKLWWEVVCGKTVNYQYIVSRKDDLKELRHGWRILKKLANFFKFVIRNPS